MRTLFFLTFIGITTLVSAGGQREQEFVFQIGEEDQSSDEFNILDFRDIVTVELLAEGKLDGSQIPLRLIHPDSSYSPKTSGAVQEITILFDVTNSQKNHHLRLSRGGDSSTLVIVDNAESHTVTAQMLGSDEGYMIGAYDLNIGRLDRGRHSIRLSIPDDGLGHNGSYRWDSICLYCE